MDPIALSLQQLEQVIRHLPRPDIGQVIQVLLQTWEKNRCIYILGSKDDAADALRMASALNNCPPAPGGNRFKAIALAEPITQPNDLDQTDIFAEQLNHFLRPRDVVIAISASGNSPRVLNGLKAARGLGAVCIAFTGQDGGQLTSRADICMRTPAGLNGQGEYLPVVLEHVVVLSLRQIITAGLPSRRRAVFLDRDGVIGYNRSDYVKSWAEFAFLPGAVDSICQLALQTNPIIVVSNQSAVGRGFISQETAEEINQRMQAEICLQGGRLDGIYICPHRPDENCNCRKPRPGLLYQAALDHQIDLEASFFIGDALSDIEAALTAGCHPILVLTGRGSEQQQFRDPRRHASLPVLPDIAAAIQYINEL